MSCPCDTPASTDAAAAAASDNCCPSAFCSDKLLSLPEAQRMNLTGVRSGSKCLNTFQRTKEGFLVNDGKGGAIVTSQPQVRVPYLRTLLYDAQGRPILNEAGNPEEDDPPGVDSLLVSGGCGLQWRYRGRANYRQKLVWDGCKWVTENDQSAEIDDYQALFDGRDDCDYFPLILIKQGDGTYKMGYRQTHFRIAGEIIAFGGALNKVPGDCLPCDGTAYAPELYPTLFEMIGYKWGNESGDFRVPDLRGEFLRGVDHGAGKDPDAAGRTAKYTGGNTGDAVGSFQTDAFQCHEHDLPVQAGAGAGEFIDSNSTMAQAAAETVVSNGIVESDCGVPRTADETRPTNASVEYIIYAGCLVE